MVRCCVLRGLGGRLSMVGWFGCIVAVSMLEFSVLDMVFCLLKLLIGLAWFCGCLECERWVEAFEWAMLVPDCIALSLLFIDSCEEKNKRYAHSQPHRGRLCMEPCIPCEEKCLSHTQTDAENHCKPKKQPPPNAVLW